MNSWIKLLFLVSVHMIQIHCICIIYNDTFSVLYVCVCMFVGGVRYVFLTHWHINALFVPNQSGEMGTLNCVSILL